MYTSVSGDNWGTQHHPYFSYAKKPSYATTKLTLLVVSKDEWNIKEGTGKSIKNALYALQCAKTHLPG